jgi:hypothetical protein
VAPTFYVDGPDGSSLGLGFAFFELPQKGGAFSFTISTVPFITSLTLFKIEEYSISYDES